jgi:hypothetical protein
VQYNFVLAQLLPFIPNSASVNNQYDYAGASYEGGGYG